MCGHRVRRLLSGVTQFTAAEHHSLSRAMIIAALVGLMSLIIFPYFRLATPGAGLASIFDQQPVVFQGRGT
jgi:hypothetical protein